MSIAKMNCPKCKSEIKNNSIKCPVCSTRIGRTCPTCGEYNLITNKKCSSCGAELLKSCPHCKAINVPTATNCRKCGQPMKIETPIVEPPKIETPKVEIEPDIVQKLQEAPVIKEVVKEEPIHEETIKQEEQIEVQTENITEENSSDNTEMTYDANYYSLANAQSELLIGIKDTNINVISINGDNEYAKTFLHNSIRKELSTLQIAFLPGKCTPHTQLTPLGLIQDVLLNIFNITNFCLNKPQLKKDSIKFFKQDFPTLSTDEVYDLINILYPENVDDFDNLFKNKERTTNIVLKVFTSIIARMNTVILIDNLEYIDSFSFDVLNILLSDQSIKNRLTLIVTYTKEQSAVNYIFPDSLDESSYKDITISEFSNEQIEPIFANYKDYNLSADIKSRIVHFSKQNMTAAEQLIHLVKDSTDSGAEIKLYDNIDSIVENRLIILKKTNYEAYLVLCAVAIFGYKFHPIILTSIFNLDNNAINATINTLLEKHFIIQDATGFEFKTMSIWNAALTSAQKDTEIFKAVNQALYQIVSRITLSSPFITSIITKNLDAKEEQYSHLMNIAQQTAYIGDVRLYILCLEQMLEIIENQNTPQINFVKYGVYTQLGKLLESSVPNSATEYLSKAILMAPDEQNVEKIELLGYLASASMRLKNYNGAIECIDKTLELTPEDAIVEKALIKTRFLKPLESLGHSGAIINLISNEILPVFNDALNRKISYKILTPEELFKTILKTNIKLMKAYAIQGNLKAFETFNETIDLCQKYQTQDNEIMTELHVVYALVHTLWGYIEVSGKILQEVETVDNDIQPTVKSTINLIKILNKFFADKENLTYDELFEATKYADDTNDEFTKNIIKLILGKLIADRTSAKEAMKIYSEQAEYFANIQNALGVMLSWYFIAQAKMSISGVDEAIDILTKAIDVAKMPNISNIYFLILFNKLMCDIYMTKQDFEASKMYLEIALQQAGIQGLKYPIAQLQMLYAKFLQDYVMTTNEDKEEGVQIASSELEKAEQTAEELNLESLKKEVKKAKTVLKSFCEVNNITQESEG